MGRPTKYTDKLAGQICIRLASGESLRRICSAPDMPDKATVLRWVVAPDHPFCDQYMIAREAAGYSHADNVTDIADELRFEEDADPQRLRVALMGYQWAAERMAPKKHSPKQLMEHTGKDGGPIESKDVTERDAKEFASRIASLASAEAAGGGTSESDD